MPSLSMILGISLFLSINCFALRDSTRVDSLAVEVIAPFPQKNGIVGLGYSLLNSLHIDSHSWTVQRLCPIAQGNTISPAQIDDVERIMRSYPFWDDVQFEWNEDSSAAIIHVHELWTTKVNFSIKYVADEIEWGVALEEENIAGLGAYLTGGYKHNIEHDWWQYGQKLYGFPFHAWDVAFRYDCKGNEWLWSGAVQRSEEYYPNGDPVYTEMGMEKITMTEYYSGAKPYRYIDREKNYANVEYLHKIGKCYPGIAVGFMEKSLWEREYENSERTDSSNSSEPLSIESHRWIPLVLRFSFLSREYLTMRNVDNFSRPEDIPIGWNITFAAGLNTVDDDNESSDENGSGSYWKGPGNTFFLTQLDYASIGRFGYVASRLGYKRKYGCDKYQFRFRMFEPVAEESIWRFGIGCDWFGFGRCTADKWLIADGRTGFRGLPAYYGVQCADHSAFAKVSAELRIFPKFELLTFRPGFAAFADIGGVTHSRIFPDNSELIVDYGISFRICSTRSSRGNVSRFELSYSPQTKTIGFTIDSVQALSFYLPIVLSPLLPD